MVLNVLGTTLYYSWIMLICTIPGLPPRAILGCAIFYAFGGGPHVWTAMLHGVIAESTSEKTISKAFYDIQTVVQITQIVSPAIGSLLLEFGGIYLPCAVALLVFLLVVGLLLRGFSTESAQRNPSNTVASCKSSSPGPHTRLDEINSTHAKLTSVIRPVGISLTGNNIDGINPQSSSTSKTRSKADESHSPSQANSPGSSSKSGRNKLCESCAQSEPSDVEPGMPTWAAAMHAEFTRVTRMFFGPLRRSNDRPDLRQDLTGNESRLSLAMVAFFVTSLGRQFLGILLQYVSVRYHWTIAQAGYLFSLKSITTILLFMAILPFITKYLTTIRSIHPTIVNLYVAKTSIVLLCTGALLIALSPTIGFFIPSLMLLCLGFGFGAAMQALVTALIDDQSLIARMYSLISLFESMGTLVGHSLLSVAFARGIGMGGSWAIGMPFFVCSGFYLLAAIPVWMVSLPAGYTPGASAASSASPPPPSRDASTEEQHNRVSRIVGEADDEAAGDTALAFSFDDSLAIGEEDSRLIPRRSTAEKRGRDGDGASSPAMSLGWMKGCAFSYGSISVDGNSNHSNSIE
ncbi:major facilitator superfamily domain-containing protein [Peziza echinospora]|nr:major facilitator superfamily domain-containing protein [Peziza echinospora]